jgi:hypothetical protein
VWPGARAPLITARDLQMVAALVALWTGFASGNQPEAPKNPSCAYCASAGLRYSLPGWVEVADGLGARQLPAADMCCFCWLDPASLPEDTDAGLVAFVRACLTVDPAARPTVAELLQHAFFHPVHARLAQFQAPAGPHVRAAPTDKTLWVKKSTLRSAALLRTCAKEAQGSARPAGDSGAGDVPHLWLPRATLGPDPAQWPAEDLYFLWTLVNGGQRDSARAAVAFPCGGGARNALEAAIAQRWRLPFNPPVSQMPTLLCAAEDGRFYSTRVADASAGESVYRRDEVALDLSAVEALIREEAAAAADDTAAAEGPKPLSAQDADARGARNERLAGACAPSAAVRPAPPEALCAAARVAIRQMVTYGRLLTHDPATRPELVALCLDACKVSSIRFCAPFPAVMRARLWPALLGVDGSYVEAYERCGHK